MSPDTTTSALERRLRAGSAAAADDAAAAADRLAARAADENLLDVAYATTDSPIGPLLLAATPTGLVRLAFGTEEADAVLEQLATQVSPRVLEAPAELDDIRRELDEYFEGRRQGFDLALDHQLSHGFRLDALKALIKVPYGSTVTYSELAQRAGRPRAQRAAGSACGTNPIPIVVPCHRVVRTGGVIGNYGGGPEAKRYLLDLEGSLEGLSTR